MPLLIAEMAEAEAAGRATLPRGEWRDWPQLRGPLVVAAATVLFVFMHAVNFPELVGSATALYLFLLVGLSGALLCRGLRRVIVVPATAPERHFAIVYDTFLKVQTKSSVLVAPSNAGFARVAAVDRDNHQQFALFVSSHLPRPPIMKRYQQRPAVCPPGRSPGHPVNA